MQRSSDSRLPRASRGTRRRTAPRCAPAIATVFAAALGVVPLPLARAAEVVARLETEPTDATEFVLHGTLPIPPGTFPSEDGSIPFGVELYDGTIVPAQTEIVSRYARADGGADIVEVLARVRRDPAAAPEARLVFDVVEAPHAKGTIEVSPAIFQLLDAPNPMLLVTRDVFGNPYAIDLLDRNGQWQSTKSVVRDGGAAVTLETYGVMRPLSGSPDALPHLFGVHAYITVYTREPVVLVDLRINNGPSGLDAADPADDPMGKVYFDALRLALPTGWEAHQLFEDPFWEKNPTSVGTWSTQQIVTRPADGSFHMMPPQAQFHRRLAIAPSGLTARARALLERRGLGFARGGTNATGDPLYAWDAPQTARYFPQKCRLPDVSYLGDADAIRGMLGAELVQLVSALTSGETTEGDYPVASPVLGWAHPFGLPTGSMTGNAGIHLLDGIETAVVGSGYGYRLALARHRMQTDRQPVCLYDADGEPTALESWVQSDGVVPYVPFELYQTIPVNVSQDAFGYWAAPTFHAEAVAQLDVAPAYEDALLAFAAHDLQHLVRYTRSAKVLAYLGNDALAKDDLRLVAELFRLSYHPYANTATGYVQTGGLAEALAFVDVFPNKGLYFNRGHAWGLDAVNAAYAMGDDAWRAKVLPWFDDVLEAVVDAQVPCSGALSALVNADLLDGEYRGRKTYQTSIIQNALVGTFKTVYQDPGQKKAQLRNLLDKSFASLVSPWGWSEADAAPWNKLAVGPLELDVPIYCNEAQLPAGASEDIDTSLLWNAMALAYDHTGDAEYLERALAMAGGDVDLTAPPGLDETAFAPLLEQLTQTGFLGDLENRAALLAVIQQSSDTDALD